MTVAECNGHAAKDVVVAADTARLKEAPTPPRKQRRVEVVATSASLKEALFDAPVLEGIAHAALVAKGDVCNRYQTTPSAQDNWLLKCEVELADIFGKRYGLGVASGGMAIMLGVSAVWRTTFESCDKSQVRVYSNSFTFNAVPSAIVNAGFQPVFLETDARLCICLDDLERQVKEDQASGKYSRYLLVLSYMRGRVPDMDRVLALCSKYGVVLYEDNAHGYQAGWKGRKLGSFGVGCAMSTQANKLINTGEGGFVFTDCPRQMAFLLFSAGCYEQLFAKHGDRMCPPKEAIEEFRFTTANFSCRLSNWAAALAYPQIKMLEKRAKAHNDGYALLETLVTKELEAKAGDAKLHFIPQYDDVDPVYDSLQLRLSVDEGVVDKFVASMCSAGYKMQKFASAQNARYYRSWGYCLDRETQRFEQTDANLAGVIDLRLLCHDDESEIRKMATDIVSYFLDAVSANPHAA